MKKSELKEIIRGQFLAEADDSKKGNSEEQKRMEGAIRDDRDHIKNLEKDIKDNEDKLSKLKKDKPEDVSEGGKYYEDKVDEGLLDFLKKKKEAAPVKKEDPNPIIGVDYDGNYIRKDGTMAEAMTEAEEVDVEDNEDINVDIEDEVDIDDESSKSEIEVDSELAGEDSDVAAILGLLTKAQSEAKALGDEKLMDQIGNTITYYTRQHVVAEEEGMDPERFQGSGGDEVDSDSIVNVTKDNPAEDAGIGFALDESTSRFKKLAGII